MKDTEESILQYEKQARTTLDEQKRRTIDKILAEIRTLVAEQAKSAGGAVVIDTSPAMNLLTYNALLYAEELIVPVGMDLMAIIGARQTLNGVAEVRELWPDRRLELLAALPTFTSATNNATRSALEALDSGIFL